jgi:predicted membrane-bound dolichyl-phosphate-mannose-protein mannosyltransferase
MDLAKTVDRLVEAEVSKLEAVRDRIHVEGYNSETAQILAIRVKDLKGLTEAHGYALVAAIAKSLCGVIDDPRARLLHPVAMLDTHTAFLRAAVVRNIRGLGDPAAEALLSKLETHVRSHRA